MQHLLLGIEHALFVHQVCLYIPCACCRIVLECVDCLWDKCCIRFGNEARLRDQVGHTWCVSSFLSQRNPRVQWWAHQEPQPPIRDDTTDTESFLSHITQAHTVLMSGHEAKCSFSGSTLIPRLSYQVWGLASPSSSNQSKTDGRIPHHTRILIIAT